MTVYFKWCHTNDINFYGCAYDMNFKCVRVYFNVWMRDRQRERVTQNHRLNICRYSECHGNKCQAIFHGTDIDDNDDECLSIFYFQAFVTESLKPFKRLVYFNMRICSKYPNIHYNNSITFGMVQAPNCDIELNFI